MRWYIFKRDIEKVFKGNCMELWYIMYYYFGVMDYVYCVSGVCDLVGGGIVLEGRGY